MTKKRKRTWRRRAGLTKPPQPPVIFVTADLNNPREMAQGLVDSLFDQHLKLHVVNLTTDIDTHCNRMRFGVMKADCCNG